MAAIKDIIEIEKVRGNLQECSVINLFKEGSFYRAYEWSAWLCYRFISQFKVTHRVVKGVEDTVTFVGFPVTSLEKWIPEGAGVELKGDDESQIALTLSESTVTQEMFENGMADDFTAWKKSIPLTEPKRKQAADSPPFASSHSAHSLSSVAQRILAFPLESKSPMECMLFIAELKKNISEIF